MSHSRDPLDYLIGDEPIPEELRQDTEFRAAYAEAEADLGIIRRGLAAYAEQTPPSESPEPVRRRSRWAGWTLGIAAAAACLVVIVGLSGTLLNNLFQSSLNRASDTAGSGAAEQAERDSSGEKSADAPREPAPSARKPGSEGSRGRLVECAEQVARGHVWTTTPLGNGRLKVEIKVTRQLVPAGTPETIFVQVKESKEWRTGREVLIVVPRDGTDPTAIWPDTEPERTSAAEDEARRSALDNAECPSR